MNTDTLPMRDHVVSVIRNEILALRYEPGQKLAERQLCEITGASRTALREGLRQLEAEGFVEIIPNRGPVIPKLTSDQIKDVYHLRTVLEADLARHAADHATGLQIGELKDICAGIRTAIEAKDRLALIEAKGRYYDWFLRISGNAEMALFMRRLLGRSTLIWPASMVQNAFLANETIEEIEAIVRAIAQHDRDLAGQKVCEHLRNAMKVVLDRLKQ